MSKSYRKFLATRYAQEAPLLAAFLTVVTVLQVLVLSALLYVFNLLEHSDDGHDTIALTLTALEILLVVVALGGFWVLRSTVIARAESTAKEELIKYLAEDGKGASMIRRGAQDWLNANPPTAQSDEATTGIMEGLDD